MIKFLKSWLPAILWAVFIFILSGRSSLGFGVLQIGEWEIVFRRFFHLAEYFILTLFLMRGFLGYNLSFKKALIFSIVFAGLYAFSDEIHQSFVPGRSARMTEFIVDIIGVFLVIPTLAIEKFFKIIRYVVQLK